MATQEINIRIHGNDLTLRRNSLGHPAQPPEDGHGKFVLVALSDTSTNTQKDVENTGAEFLSYIDDGVYLYKWDATKDIRQLEAANSVRLVNSYPPSVKVHADLKSELDELRKPQRSDSFISAERPDSISGTNSAIAAPVPLAADALISLQIHFHKGTKQDEVKRAKDRWSSTGVIKGDSAKVYERMVVAAADPIKVDQIAVVPEVFVIEENPEFGDDSVLATDAVNVTGSILSENGYRVQGSDQLLDGTGEIISIGDYGFDRGKPDDMQDVSDIHPAFVKQADRCRFFCMHDEPGLAVQKSCIKDTRGHGTHVCGIAVGFEKGASQLGAAPGATLFSTQLLDHNPVDGERKTYPGPMEDIYNKSAEAIPQYWPKPIFSQSWGVDRKKAKKKPGYGTSTRKFDTFLRIKNTLVCRSAGNDYNRFPGFPGICGRYAAGKNVLTVGACNSSTSVSTHDMFEGSSHGTHEHGRQKPDVVAPGVDVRSARSRDSPLPTSTCEPLYEIRTGTSMATPLVAGCAAVLNQALRETDKSYTDQSGMLLKALLINGAVALDGKNSQYVKGSTQSSGYGRVDMLSSLKHLKTSERNATYGMGKLDTGQKVTGVLFEVDGAKPQGVKITLCWADEGGEDLMCQLRLTLTQLSTGDVWFGNSNGWVAKADAMNADESLQYVDRVNNVQQIYCQSLKEGKYRMDAHFYEAKSKDAEKVPYGLAWLFF